LLGHYAGLRHCSAAVRMYILQYIAQVWDGMYRTIFINVRETRGRTLASTIAFIIYRLFETKIELRIPSCPLLMVAMLTETQLSISGKL
jgi:hypothetical protein